MSTPLAPQLSFDLLVNAISHVHTEMTAQASRAVNASLTLRNWAIGFYVEEYERKGADRVAYGDKLMDVLATSLTERGISRCDRREIYRYRQFYLSYPQIVETVSPQLVRHGSNIVESVSPQLQANIKVNNTTLYRCSIERSNTSMEIVINKEKHHDKHHHPRF